MAERKHVAVLMGGWSAERSVSLKSGEGCAAALERAGYRVTRIDGNQITAEKNVTLNEPYFQGHFPGHPIMPGVLQLEAMAQVAGILTLKQADNAGKIAYFMAADKVKWRKPVKPGDVLQIDIELLRARGKVAKAKGICTVRGEVVSEAEITFTLAGNS